MRTSNKQHVVSDAQKKTRVSFFELKNFKKMKKKSLYFHLISVTGTMPTHLQARGTCMLKTRWSWTKNYRLVFASARKRFCHRDL